MLTVLLGNVIVLFPMWLVGHAGTKHGIPFPVLLRSSFGTVGANAPALLRGRPLLPLLSVAEPTGF